MLFTKLFSKKKENSYEFIKLPIKYSRLDVSLLDENTDDDWKAYKKWFFDIKESRIEELQSEVRRTTSSENWKADFSRESIVSLSAWFDVTARGRPTTRAEQKWIRAHVPDGPSREITLTYRLDEKTESLCWDIGMYLGDTAINLNPKLKWKQLKGRHVWAGLMVVNGELRHDPKFVPSKNFPTEFASISSNVAAHAIEKAENKLTLLNAFDRNFSRYHSEKEC